MSDHKAVRLHGVTRTYGGGGTAGVRALDGVSLALTRGTFTAIMGPSGSGKSTLLNCAAGLETVDAGEVWVDGTSITGWRPARLARLRRERLGFVFQDFHLMPYLTAAHNVALPLRLARRRVDATRVAALLAQVGLTGAADRRPAELSGGQQQRVAIARALVARPAVLFADEPTGSLDTASARQVLGLLRATVDHDDQTTVMVTHDPIAAAYADVVVFLVDGRVVGEMRRPTADAVAAHMTHLGDLAATLRPGGVHETDDAASGADPRADHGTTAGAGTHASHVTPGASTPGADAARAYYVGAPRTRAAGQGARSGGGELEGAA